MLLSAHIVQSLNVIELKEFRELLLILRESLRDSDIPHRTTLRNKIIETWRQYLIILRKDLEVSLNSFLNDS